MRTLTLLAVSGMSLLLAMWLAGCNDSSSKGNGTDAARVVHDEGHHADEGHHGHHQHDADATHGDSDSHAASDIKQTTCPVMGNPIDPNVFVEYKGRKVYFCCKACISKFQADPDKYLAKLDSR